jgi:ABC-type transport system involved in multi-copper enzyme maturation permease subunit
MLRAFRRWLAIARARVAMPLLGKELSETAARRRTFTLRVVYAVLLYLIFAATIPHRVYESQATHDPYAMLGIGRELFEQLAVLQAFGVILFQPALMCGRITQEKERDSLVLLFLTELRPWEIILQKFIGGLIPMLTFLLLGLPLAGVAYAYGGVESRQVLDMTLGILISSIQIGALALMCSSWSRSTVSALIWAYLFTVLLYVGPPLLCELIAQFSSRFGNHYEYRRLSLLLLPEAAVEIAHRGYWGRSRRNYLFLLPCIASIFFFLGLARWSLVRRANVPPSDLLRRLFARLDALMKWANRFVGGVVVLRKGGSLPLFDPVFWRETHRRVLGKPHYLVRLLCVIEIPTVLLCVAIVLGSTGPFDPVALSLALAVLSALAIFSLVAVAANSIVSERVGQTLEVLLTTPLSAADIVRQKERALRRLICVLAAPLLTIIATKALLFQGATDVLRNQQWFAYVVCAVLSVIIYLPLFTWLALWIGLWVRTRFQAILLALGVVGFWMVLGIVLLVAIHDNRLDGTGWHFLVLLSPLGIPALNESDTLFDWFPQKAIWVTVIANALLYTFLARLIRRRLIAEADYRLRR